MQRKHSRLLVKFLVIWLVGLGCIYVAKVVLRPRHAFPKAASFHGSFHCKLVHNSEDGEFWHAKL